MDNQPALDQSQIAFFEKNGFLKIEHIIPQSALETYQRIYDDFLSGAIQTGDNRSDLGAGLGDSTKENITQIMWPSDFMPVLLEMVYHQHALTIARALLGPDLALDFDMLINKAPFTNTPTPWHQDAAYWVNMPDRRALSCWMALDRAILDNGCMWYVPGSHLDTIRPHRFAGKEGGALTCEASEAEGVYIELEPGSCILHHGGTLHYSRGNSTASNRRAYILNFRPQAMIDFERSLGFDHGRNGGAADRKQRHQDEL
jgi:phytanoyl-CoA hydroxylase